MSWVAPVAAALAVPARARAEGKCGERGRRREPRRPGEWESFTRPLFADPALGPATALLALVTAWVTLATRRPAGWRAFPVQRR